MASLLATEYPQQAAARIAIPDDLYEEVPEDAPCIVVLDAAVLPDDPGQSLSDCLAHEWLGRFLQQAWLQTQQRRSLQGLCGVLFAPVNGQILAQHLAQLGYQQAPDGQLRLLRYQDPRVMQRVWPALTDAQKNAWLGAASSWWGLQVPWGPVAPAAPPVWFKANAPSSLQRSEATDPLADRALLDARQWLIAHAAPAANALWQLCAQQDDIPVSRHPSKQQMDWLLAAAVDSGVQPSQLENFLLTVWYPYLGPQPYIRPSEGNEEADAKFAARCASVAHAIEQNPQAGYRQLLTLVTAQTLPIDKRQP